MSLRSKEKRLFVQLSLLGVLLFFAQTVRAVSASPMEVIESGTQKVLSILRESQTGQAPSLRQREGEILQVVGNYIDFDEMAKTSLGYDWKQQSPDKRREFTGLFKRLLFNTYVDRLEKYSDQEIFYDSQTIDGDFATVRTHVIHNNQNVSIDYRLQKQGGQWKVYDVQVEGISYDANYHAQISSILANKSFDALLVILRQKVDRGG